MGRGSSKTGGGAAATFEKKYNLENVPEENYEELAQGLKDLADDYDFFGIRYLEPKYAAQLKDSHVWDDGTKTGETLDGVSAIEIGSGSSFSIYNDPVDKVAGDIKKAYQSADIYADGQKKPFIVYGRVGEKGNDPGEVVISSPKILDISKYMK